MRVSIIVAASTNNVIGANGELPWRLTEDLRRFKRLTIGKPVIMGRLTHESIGWPLPERQNIVLSRRTGYAAEGCDVAATMEESLALAGDAAEIMIIGGGSVYEMFLPNASRIYLTRVHAEIEGDAYFPDLRKGEWETVDSEEFAAGEDRSYPFTFLTLERRRKEPT